MTQPEDQARIEAASVTFQRMAEMARQEDAPLYQHLSGHVANDPELMAMSALSRPNRSMAYMLYYTVHYLLLGGVEHQLARYYPSLTDQPLDPAGAYPVFRDFCLQHADEIRVHISGHNVQTNEVGHMSALLLGIDEAARRGGDKPLGLVEVGPAAGLNLCFDRYFFDYGRIQWGDQSSPVHIHCQLEDDRTPPLVAGRPTIGYRIGLDIDPIDITDERQARWMMAATWPDHRDLAETQKRAVELVRKAPPKIIRGDALTVGDLIADVPPELTLCVYQSVMLSQLPEEKRQRFVDILTAEAASRPIYFVSMGGGVPAASVRNLSPVVRSGVARRSRVDFYWWENGEMQGQQIADTHTHGRSLRWLG